MITKLTGRLVRVGDDDCRLEVGPIEYQILLPEAVRMQIQMRVGESLSLHISEYLEGGPNANKFIPRKIGFLSESELEFFDLFCTVDKIGAKKALKAMARPIRDISNAIAREDAKWLTSLPGIGASTAEQIVTTLKRKVTRFAVAAESAPQNAKAGQVTEEVYQGLLSLGLSPFEARSRIDQFLAGGNSVETVEATIFAIFNGAAR
jgi:Holliday junction DNA helicase RuvA